MQQEATMANPLPRLAQLEERQHDLLEVPQFESRGGDHTLDTRLHCKWEIRLAENHSCETGVYLRRWRIETPWFSVRLHHWLHSDDNRAPHDHPWNFVTVVLRGSYIDEGIGVRQRVHAGRAYYRPSTHAHWVHLDRGEVWTLVLTGPKIRRWGFWVDGLNKWIRSFKYFYQYGDHPCD